MTRALIVLMAVTFFVVGMTVTFVTWNPNGWTVLAGAGVLLLGYDQYAAAKLQALEDLRSERCISDLSPTSSPTTNRY